MENRFGKKKGMLLIAVVALCVVGTGVAVLANNGTLAAKVPVSTTQATVNSTSAKIGDPTQYIGETKVKAILDTKVAGATITKLNLEMDDGRVEYDGEMYLGKLDYDFTIDAKTGAILKWTTEARSDATSSATVNPVVSTSAAITTASGAAVAITDLDAAKAIALKRVDGATITKLELSKDDGRTQYDGEMVLANIKYTFKIDAATGVFMEWKAETEDDSHGTATAAAVKPATKTTSGTTATYIGEAAARAIALKKAPGATVTELYLEYDDGKVEYDGKMILGNTEYEFEIDAVSGAILEWETDTVDVEDDSDDSSDDDSSDDEVDDED